MLKIVKVVKKDEEGNEKTFFNIYLFGVAIKPVNKQDSLKLYYQVKGYLNGSTDEK